MTVKELSPEKLRLECSPDQVGCETSAELGPVDGIIGQDRALKALKFGVEMKGQGFNVHVAGPPITGKRPAARSFLFFFQAEDGIRDLTVTGVQTVLFR